MLTVEVHPIPPYAVRTYTAMPAMYVHICVHDTHTRACAYVRMCVHTSDYHPTIYTSPQNGSGCLARHGRYLLAYSVQTLHTHADRDTYTIPGTPTV